MNTKILFIENIPWLQRVDEHKLVDSRGIIQIDEQQTERGKLQEKKFWTLNFSLSQALSKLSSTLFSTLPDEESWGSV